MDIGIDAVMLTGVTISKNSQVRAGVVAAEDVAILSAVAVGTGNDYKIAQRI